MTVSVRIVHAYGIDRRVLCGLGTSLDLPTNHEAVGLVAFDEDDMESCEQCKRVLSEIADSAIYRSEPK